MKYWYRKLTAFMMAVALVVSFGSFAHAEQPAVAAQTALERGANLKLDMRVQVNKDVVVPLLGMFIIDNGEGGTTTILETVFSAINKLNTSIIINKDSMSARIGTASGDLVTMQGMMNPETFENKFTTSLIPDAAVTMDPATIKTLMGSMLQSAPQQMTADEVAAMIAPYQAAITTFLNDQVMATAEIEQGPFDVAGVGTFESRATVPVTSHGIADMLQTVLTVFKNDTRMQEMLTQAMSTTQTGLDASGTEMPVPADVATMIKEMEDGIADMKSKANTTGATVRYYSSPSDTTSPAYLEIESDPTQSEPMFATVLIQSGEKSMQVAIALLAKPNEEAISGSTTDEQIVSLSTKAPEAAAAATAEPTAAVTANEAIDWAALHQAVLNGEDQTATLMNMTISSETTDTSTNGRMAFDLRTPMTGMGSMYVGLEVTSAMALGDTVNQSGTMSLSLFTPAPIMTMTFSLTETDEQPAPVAAATQEYVLTESTSEVAGQQIMGIVMSQGLPKMLENLKVVLPEEAGILTLLLQSAPQTTQP